MWHLVLLTWVCWPFGQSPYDHSLMATEISPASLFLPLSCVPRLFSLCNFVLGSVRYGCSTRVSWIVWFWTVTKSNNWWSRFFSFSSEDVWFYWLVKVPDDRASSQTWKIAFLVLMCLLFVSLLKLQRIGNSKVVWNTEWTKWTIRVQCTEYNK